MTTCIHITGLLFTFQMLHQVLSPVMAVWRKHILSAAGWTLQWNSHCSHISIGVTVCRQMQHIFGHLHEDSVGRNDQNSFSVIMFTVWKSEHAAYCILLCLLGNTADHSLYKFCSRQFTSLLECGMLLRYLYTGSGHCTVTIHHQITCSISTASSYNSWQNAMSTLCSKQSISPFQNLSYNALTPNILPVSEQSCKGSCLPVSPSQHFLVSQYDSKANTNSVWYSNNSAQCFTCAITSVV